MQPGTMGRDGLRAVRLFVRPEKEKKWDGTEAVPPMMHEFRRFMRLVWMLGKARGLAKEKGAQPMPVLIFDLSLVSGLYAGKRRRRERISAWGGA
jgi:hypothetical protein